MIVYLLILTYLSKEVVTQSTDELQSICPNIFKYENRTEDKWYGIISIQTPEELSGVWITVQLDNKAELLGNWFGETFSSDNKDFRITNPDYVLEEGPPVAIRFFVKYNQVGPIPRVSKIRLNGKTICSEKHNELKPTTPKLHISKPRPTKPPPTDVNNEREHQLRPGIGEETNNRPSGDRDTTANGYNRPNRPNGVNNEREHQLKPGSGEENYNRPSGDRDTTANGYNRPNRPNGLNNEGEHQLKPGSGGETYNRPSGDRDTTSNGYNRPNRPNGGEQVTSGASYPTINRPVGDLDASSNGYNRPSGSYDRNPVGNTPIASRNYSYDTVTEPSSTKDNNRPVAGGEAAILNYNEGFGVNHNPIETVNNKSNNKRPRNQHTGQNTYNKNRGETAVTRVHTVHRTTERSNSLSGTGHGLFRGNNVGTNPRRPTQSSTHTSNQDNTQSNINKPKNNESDEDFFPGDFNVIKVTNSVEHTNKNPLQTQQTNSCGTVALRPKAFIANGQDTIPGEWPWHSAIYHTKGIQLVYICGASLISDRHVLTAAHCVTKARSNKQVEPEGILVYFGKYNLKTFGPETQDRDVSDIFVHPEFNFSMYYNDVAIIKLSRPVEITDYVRPVCLWEDSTDLENMLNKEGTVIGWGFDENKRISEKLMQAKMPIVSTIKCIYSNRDFFARFTFDKNFCAGFRNGTSVCNGDSGGSMVFPKTGTSGQNTVWQIRGIVSVGVALQTEGVCDTSQYVIFTDVAKHLTWIKQILYSN